MEDNNLEKVEPFNAKQFNDNMALNSKYLHFEPGDQKDLIVANPRNVTTSKFGDPKLVLRLDVLRIDGREEIKQWDVSNALLIKELTKYLAVSKQAYHFVVKRGLGQNRATSYTVMEMPA